MANSYIYTPGGTIKAGPALYILRQADEELLQLCQEGKYAYVLTSRQMGKSSLVVQTTLRLEGEGITSIMIDLSNIGTTDATAENWYRGVVLAIEDKLEEQGQFLSTDVYDWWETHSPLTITQRFTRFFRDVLLQDLEGQVVVFIDEIDTTLKLDFTDDFFIAIRSLYTARAQSPIYERLSFVLIGVATPSDLILDARRTPFNIGHRVDLTDFTPAEASPLAAGLGVNEADQAKVFERILDWTGGHPYLTQKLCIEVSRQSRPHWKEEDVDGVVRQTFFGDRGNDDHNLQNVRDLLVDPRRCPDLYQVLTTYRAIWRDRQLVSDEEQSPIKAHLKLSGVVKRDAEKNLRVRNKIYQTVFDDQWVADHLPVNWGKRIKQLQRTIAASLLLVGVMAGLTGWAVIERQKAAAERRTAEEQRREAIMERDNARRAESKAEQRRIDAEAATQLANQRQKEAAQAKEAEAKQRQEADRRTVEAQEASQRALLAQQAEKEQRRRAEKGEADAREKARIVQKAEKRANQQATIAQLREQAARVLNLLPTANAVPGMILAIDTMDSSWLESSVEGRAQASLLKAVQTSQEVNRLQGHGDIVSAVAFSPNGQQVASGGRDGTVRLWNVWTGKPIGEPLKGHKSGVTAVAFSPDGKYIVSGSLDLTIRRWDAQTGQPIGDPIEERREGEEVNTVAVSPDSTLIASSTPYAVIHLWDIETGDLIRELKGHGGSGTGVTSIAFSPNGKYIVSGSDNQTVRLWDAKTGELIVEPLQYESWVTSVAFSWDSKRIAIAEGMRAWVWDVELEKYISEPLRGHQDTILSVAFSPDDKQIVTGSRDNTVRLWDVEEGQLIGQPLWGHENDVNSVAFSPNGKQIISGSDDWTIRLWDAERDQPIGKLLQEHSASSLVLNSNGQWITGDWDGTIRLWDVRSTLSGQSVGEPLQGYSGSLMAFSLSGQRIVSKDRNRKLWLWDVQTGRSIGELIQTSQSEIISVAFDSRGQRIVSGGQDGTVQMWDARTGQPTSEPIPLHKNGVTTLAFTSDDQIIVSGGQDGALRLLNGVNGQPIGEPIRGYRSGLEASIVTESAITSVAFDSRGQRIVSGSYDNTVRLWNAQTGQPIGTPIRGHQGWVHSVAFSPDGQRIVSSGSDKTVRLWDAQTGDPIGEPLIGHQGWVDSVAFSPDGQQIIATGQGNKVWLWDVSPESWIAIACNRLRYHPLLIQPENVFADLEFIEVAQQARATCQRRVWQHPSITGQNSPSWLGRMFHHLAEVFTSPKESGKPAG